MKYRLILSFAAILILASTTALRADTEPEYWYFVASDGCSEYVYYNDPNNHVWKVWWKCCGQTSWCFDALGQADPCGGGMIVPKPSVGTGTKATFNTAGDLVVAVPPGFGGRIEPNTGGGQCLLPFQADGTSTLTVTKALLQ